MFSNSVSSLLLFGPPGTGKTMLAKAVASRFNTTFFNVRCSSLASKWRGDSEKLIRILFQLARHNAPATVFLDEADAVLSERGTAQEHEASRRCKAELLVQLDGLESEGEGTILFLASTNLPWSLDPAILRRFHKKILVDLPEEEERLQILVSCLRTDVTSPPPLERLRELAKDTKGYSGSDLTQLCRWLSWCCVRYVTCGSQGGNPGSGARCHQGRGPGDHHGHAAEGQDPRQAQRGRPQEVPGLEREVWLVLIGGAAHSTTHCPVKYGVQVLLAVCLMAD